MSLGILGAPGGTLGTYFAPTSTRAGIDLGPTIDWTPAGREYRQRFEEGMTAYLRQASEPQPPPVGQWERSPAMLEYQRAMRESTVHAPWAAQALATQAAIIGRQADLRIGRRMQGPRRPASGLGQIWVTPAAPPGYDFASRATIGVPTWVTGARGPEHIL